MKKQRSLVIDDETYDTLQKIAEKETRSLSNSVVIAIKNYARQAGIEQ